MYCPSFPDAPTMQTLIGCLPPRPGHQVRLARSFLSDSPVYRLVRSLRPRCPAKGNMTHGRTPQRWLRQNQDPDPTNLPRLRAWSGDAVLRVIVVWLDGGLPVEQQVDELLGEQISNGFTTDEYSVEH